MTDETANETTTTAQCVTESVQPAEAEESTSKRRNHHEPHGGSRLWDRARGAFFALPRGLHIVMLIVFMILGFALATQVRAQRSDPLEGLSEQDLVTVLDELSTQEQNLRNRRTELSGELADLQSAASEAEAREQASAKAATQAQIGAGTIAVKGPGVTVSVVDPDNNLSPTQFVMTLGELRNAGLRPSTSTAFDSRHVRRSRGRREPSRWTGRLLLRPTCGRSSGSHRRSRQHLTFRLALLRRCGPRVRRWRLL